MTETVLPLWLDLNRSPQPAGPALCAKRQYMDCTGARRLPRRADGKCRRLPSLPRTARNGVNGQISGAA